MKNLTQGSVLNIIIKFSAPFLLSYFLQTLYGMADLFIAGQFNGSDVITAVSIGSQVMHMVTVIIVGMSMGTTVLIGRAVGSKDKKQTCKIIGTSTLFFLVLSIILVFLLILLLPYIVKILSTPEEAIEYTKKYLLICFIGIPFITAYNIIAAIFRGLGDSKSPMIFVSVACIFNILLDYLFIGFFNMNAEGAAYATVFSQTISVIISLVASKNLKDSINIKKSDFSLDFIILRNLITIGMPIAVQDGFIQISFLAITIIANKRGISIAAAVGIVEKIISFLFLVPSSMLSAISTLAAQNIGAGAYDRAKKTLYYGTTISVSIGIFFAIIFQFTSMFVLSMFTKDSEVIYFGTQYLRSYVVDCIFASIHFCFSGYFCACGRSIISFIHNAISIIFIRIPGAYFASVLYPKTLYPMGFAAPLGSALSAVICIIVFLKIKNKIVSF